MTEFILSFLFLYSLYKQFRWQLQIPPSYINWTTGKIGAWTKSRYHIIYNGGF